MEKDNKKKTLTITSNLKRKIDTSAINTGGKKSFAVEKKKTFKESKASVKNNQTSNHSFNSNFKPTVIPEPLTAEKPSVATVSIKTSSFSRI